MTPETLMLGSMHTVVPRRQTPALRRQGGEGCRCSRGIRRLLEPAESAVHRGTPLVARVPLRHQRRYSPSCVGQIFVSFISRTSKRFVAAATCARSGNLSKS